jgi:hypothetical protein
MLDPTDRTPLSPRVRSLDALSAPGTAVVRAGDRDRFCRSPSLRWVDELKGDTMRDVEMYHPDTELRVRFRQHRRLRDLSSARGRRLVLVDIENVVGGPCTTSARTRWAHRRLRDAVGLGPADQIVVGVDVAGLESVGWDWPRVRYAVGHGRDGADRALLEVLAEDVADRYSHVVLATGDGIFAETVAALTAAGVRVTVVAHEVALSSSLRLAASDVVLLSSDADPSVPAPRTA